MTFFPVPFPASPFDFCRLDDKVSAQILGAFVFKIGVVPARQRDPPILRGRAKGAGANRTEKQNLARMPCWNPFLGDLPKAVSVVTRGNSGNF